MFSDEVRWGGVWEAIGDEANGGAQFDATVSSRGAAGRCSKRHLSAIG